MIVHQAQQPTDRARHHRDTARRRLERDEAETLAATRYEHDVSGSVIRRQDVVRLRLDEVHTIAEAEFVDERPDAHGLVAAGIAARPADDHELGIRSSQLGQRTHGHVRTFQRLDAPDEQQQGAIEVEPGARRAPDCSPGAKKACSTPGAMISSRPCGLP